MCRRITWAESPIETVATHFSCIEDLSWLLTPSVESGEENRSVWIRAWTLSAVAPLVGN
jgi:hypothetical protein